MALSQQASSTDRPRKSSSSAEEKHASVMNGAGASPPAPDGVVVIPIDDGASQTGRPRRETSRNLTFSIVGGTVCESPTLNIPQSKSAGSPPQQPNMLWREVSADYLQELEALDSSSPTWKMPQSTLAALSLRQKRQSERKRRPKSFDFGVPLDPPTKLIENFLQRQAASGNLCLDMDMDMMEKLRTDSSQNGTTGEELVGGALHPVSELSDSTATVPAAPRDSGASAAILSSTPASTNPSSRGSSRTTLGREQHNVSFKPTQVIDPPQGEALNASISFGDTKENSSGSLRYAHGNGTDDSSSDESDIRHSNVPSLNRIQTRSRLADPPPPPPQQGTTADGVKPVHKSAQLRSGPMRSGLLQKLSRTEEEEDDPLKDADIPESFRKHKWSFMSVVQWVAFFLVMAGLVCSLTVPALKQSPLWSMSLWKWALLVFLIFCGRLVSGWVIRILVVILERNFLLRKRVLYFVYGLRKGVQNCLWFALALLAWRLVFDPKVESTTNSKVLPYVTKLLNCFLIAAIIWLIKIFLVKVLASSFHVNTYFERIRESLFGQWVLETLSGPPVLQMEQEAQVVEELDELRKAGAKVPEGMLPKVGVAPQYTGKSGMIALGKSGLMVGGGKSGVIGGGGGKSGMIAGKSGLMGQGSMDRKSGAAQNKEDGISIENLHRLNEHNISAWNMKRMMNIVRYRGIYTLAHVIDQTAAEAQDAEAQDVEIESEWQAKAVAKKIFKNVATPGARYIKREDLLRFMREPEVERAMPLFEGATETGKITKTALKNFAVHVVRERRALALSLNDTKTAVKKLHRLVDVVVGVIILIICLLVLGITTTHLLLLISSQLVLVVFIFGNTCKTIFEAIIFLFVMHPFDVGDRCVVDGNQVVVEEMNILSTLFIRYDGEKLWYPNSLLSTKYIFNYKRTPDTGDTFDFSIDASTSAEKIQTLQDKIGKYIYSKPNYWARDYNLIVKEIEDNNKMKLQLMVNHTINFGDVLERQIRRSELLLEVKKMLQELDIGYKLLPQEVRLAKNEVTHSAISSLVRSSQLSN